ncbi:hypothetical protein L6452_41368 [Arctium lappa]|uniref:Uncharacterized protein n=1 Tax=Arctium lappa TaxID=4217 RepID=A0ACB8XP54_ARCLA|nr:hypothetical protein L6452_41368 [Arctium lappa]
MQNIVTTINQDFVRQHQKFSERSGLQYCEYGHDDLLDSVISSDRKKTATAKKDGRRKINTTRGPRARRVRFSTEIAQKFFGLQDLLGFDRASKTLDWLLTNSVTAIKELVEEMKHGSSDQSNLKFLETIVGGLDEKKSVVKCVDGKKTKSRRKCEGGSFRANNAARDRLRAEARARARERTREKMRVKKVYDELVLDSKLTLMKSGGCWSEIEPQSDCKSIRCECIMNRETTSKQSNDSSALYAMFTKI